MWLIDTSTLRLKYCNSGKDHKYAILSHTWADEEVSFQDIADLETARQKAGFAKIEKTCEIARFQGLQYAWIDTCCINKDSSAELTEAINSMFEWYTQCEVCYAYIADLPSRHHQTPVGMPTTTLDWLSPSAQAFRWFTRGWTLQELIAPRRLEFYDEHWGFRGEKSSLLAKLSQHTGIDVDVLVDSAVLSEMPVASKMSWASSRQTTRVEDMAYCLLGIFNVNMPMIYGEGERAFTRLQEEIAKESNDLSLFAWTARRSPDTFFTGLLASSPAEFAGFGTIVRYRDYLDPNPEYQLTNNGVRMQTGLGLEESGKYVLKLDCGIPGKAADDPVQWLGVYLYKTAFGFARIHPERMYVKGDSTIWDSSRSTIYISKCLRGREEQRVSREVQGRMFLQYHVGDPDYTIHEVFSMPEALWNPQERHFLTMEAALQRGGGQPEVYPPFTGFQVLNISHGGSHLYSCLLFCGLFEDYQSQFRPLAVLYTDRDPSCTGMFEAIRLSQDGGRKIALLRQIRMFVRSKHSPETGEPLTWDHVRNRAIEVDQTVLTINISPDPTGIEEHRSNLAQPSETTNIYTVSVNIQPAMRPGASQH